jgi:hypothetical protein
MDEYYKAKDFVSSKCHGEMKDTWLLVCSVRPYY